jgi:hypothetical protein
MMVECSRLRRSNMRTEPSAPTLAKTSVPRANAMSYTSLSCAISCVFACWVCTVNYEYRSVGTNRTMADNERARWEGRDKEYPLKRN